MAAKKTAKKVTKPQKVDLSALELLGALNFCATLVFGFFILGLMPTSDSVKRNFSQINDDNFYIKLYTKSAADDAEKARLYALESKIYSLELLKKSEKKEAKK